MLELDKIRHQMEVREAREFAKKTGVQYAPDEDFRLQTSFDVREDLLRNLEKLVTKALKIR